MPRIAYARLVRLPNLLTAASNIALGMCVTIGRDAVPMWDAMSLLVVASMALYAAGMVFNDYFDLAEDRRERAYRPIASGQISPRRAVAIGVCLLLLGVGAAFAVHLDAGLWACGIVVAVLAYDARLKRTMVAPLSMALCRFLNVMMGMSLASLEAVPWGLRLHVAAVVALYVCGLTMFARKEQGMSHPTALRNAAAVMLTALGLAVAIPVHLAPGHGVIGYPLLLAAFGVLLVIPLGQAIRLPAPVFVQAAVKRAILGLIVLDAILAVAFVGAWGLLIILLLPPAILLGKWVYST